MMGSAIDFLLSLDIYGAMAYFWFFFIFDLPRYGLSTISVGVGALVESKRGKQPAMVEPISVLMVGHNEGDTLRRSVLSIQEQTLRDIEIVVVDDGSTDGMAEVGKALRAQEMISHFVATGIRGGKAAALNLGLIHCTREIVVCVDIDTSFDRDAFMQLIQPLNDPAVGAVSGNLAVRNPDASLMTSMQAIEYIQSISLGRRFTSMFNLLTIVSGAFGAFRRSALQSVGGWEIGPGDDGNVTNKLRRAGWHIRFAHNAWAFTDVPETVSAYVRQRMRWNRSVIRYKFRKFRSVFDPRNAQFSIFDALAIVNVLFFQVALAISFFVYLWWLFAYLGEVALMVVLSISTLYFLEDSLLFLLAIRLCKRVEPMRFTPYIIAWTLFDTYFGRVLRVMAYTDELIFRRSFRDSFAPMKVHRMQERF